MFMKICPRSQHISATFHSLLLSDDLPDMQVGKKIYNYVQAPTDADEKFGHQTTSGMPYNLLGLTRSSGQSILLQPGKWFAFLNKRSQRR